MTSLDLVDAAHLDYDEYANLQKRAYSALHKKFQVSSAFLTADFYRWKYRPPLGSGIVATVREGGRLVAANAMMPLELRRGQIKIKGWQSCDTAVLPGFRGKGYFQDCVKRLESVLDPNDIFFGFPNENSVFGLLRSGWKESQIVTTWISYRGSIYRNQDRFCSKLQHFGGGQDRLAEVLSSCGKTVLIKGSAYMNWRYMNHPTFRYLTMDCRENGRQVGYVVARKIDLLGMCFMVIMDMGALQPSLERALLRHVARMGWKEGIKWIVFQDSGLAFLNGVGACFLPLCWRVLPKKQVLLGKAKRGTKGEIVFQGPWRIQTGDWDGF